MHGKHGQEFSGPATPSKARSPPPSSEVCEELLACPHCEHEFPVRFDLRAATHIYAVACPNCERRFMARAVDEPVPKRREQDAPEIHTAPEYTPRTSLEPGPQREPRVTPQTPLTYPPPFSVPSRHPYHPPPGVDVEFAPVEIKSRWGGMTRARVVSALLIVCFILGVLMGILTFLAEHEAAPVEPEEGTLTTVTGKIMDMNGTEIAAATIRLTDLARETTSNEDGFYYFDGVPSGEHKVLVYKNDYSTIARTVVVTSRPLEVDFVLSHGSGNIDLGSDSGSGPVSTLEGSDRNGEMGVVILIFSVVVLLAAILAFYRRGYVFVVIGSVLGICTIGFGIGSIIAGIALVLTFISRTEFR